MTARVREGFTKIQTRATLRGLSSHIKFMFSVIETGGKQYKVAVGEKIKIEKLEGKEGDSVVFDKVLLAATSDDAVAIGQPYVEGGKVLGEIVRQARHDKVIVFKYRPKKRERKKKGHRQMFTEVKITEIETGK